MPQKTQPHLVRQKKRPVNGAEIYTPCSSGLRVQNVLRAHNSSASAGVCPACSEMFDNWPEPKPKFWVVEGVGLTAPSSTA